MYDITVNTEKNRLYLTLTHIESGDGRLLYEDIKNAVRDLDSGFTVVSDISQFFVADPTEGAWADEIIKFLADSGMTKVVRVTGVFSNTKGKTEKYGYTVFLAESVEKADMILDENI